MNEQFRSFTRNSAFALVVLLGLATSIAAQDHTTADQYGFQVESDVIYGVDTNYLGMIDTLRLDVYTPTSNTDDQRPLMVLVHGGNWLGGCKDDAVGIVPLAEQFVKRGYVVASINYRLGWHKAEFVQGNIAGFGITPWPEFYRSFYALDSAELKRAIYRGMQDTKGAIRFMKGRADQDSVCVEKVFVGGESAGGFVALATAFLDRDAEKPLVCGPLEDAPVPYPYVLNTTAFECDSHSVEVFAPMLLRPDLGPVEGDLNLNGHNARVKGVANFYGGVPQEAFSQDWWQGVDTPAVYMYHQTADGIVLFGNAKPYATMSAYCNLGAAPWHPRYPTMSGSGSIRNAFNAMSPPPVFTTDFQTVAPFDPNIALFDCARYADNGSYHFINGLAARAQNLAEFFAPYADDLAVCTSTAIPTGPGRIALSVHPQPASHWLRISGLRDPNIRIVDQAGRDLGSFIAHSGVLDVSGLANGSYVLLPKDHGTAPVRFMVLR